MKILETRVRGLLRQRGLSVGELGNCVRRIRPRVSQTTISTAINGRRDTTSDVVAAIADVLGTTPAYLFGEDDEVRPAASGIPIPEPDLAPIVAALNRQEPALSARIVRIVREALELATLAPAAVVDDPKGILPLFSALPEDAQSAVMAETRRRQAQHAAQRERSAG